MTIVTINDKYRVVIDSWNHTLEQYNECGVEITFGKGKGTLSQCLRRVKQLMALTVPDCSIDEYLIELARLNDEVVL